MRARPISKRLGETVRRRVKASSGVELEWGNQALSASQGLTTRAPRGVLNIGAWHLDLPPDRGRWHRRAFGRAASARAQGLSRSRVRAGEAKSPGSVTGIQLGPNVFLMLDRIGLQLHRGSEAMCPPVAVWLRCVHWARGRRARRYHAGHREALSAIPTSSFNRGDLHHILMNACAAVDAIELTPGTAVTGFEDHGDRRRPLGRWPGWRRLAVR